jgi:uncharacterized protein
MKARLPKHFNPIVMADGQHQGHLTFLLRDFKRLAEVVLNPQEPVSVDLVFRRLERMPVLEGRISGRLSVECQRCLGPMDIEINETLRLCFIESSSLETSVPEGFDPYDFIQDEAIALADLIEDELLLAIPDVPMHEDCEMPGAYRAVEVQENETEQKPNPFAQLAVLKNKITH